MQRRQVLAGVAALPFAQALPATAATRRFRMGTTRWPPDLSLRAFGQVERFLRDQADMAAPMVLGGVPWVAAAEEAPFSHALQAELTWKAPKGHPVLLSLGPLDTMRRGLAPLYGLKDNQALPPDWEGRAFDDPMVIRAYTAFCLRAAETMRPDWLATGVEVNLLAHFDPDAWGGCVALHRAVYAALKDRFPEMPILITIAAQHFLGQVDDTDTAAQMQALQDMSDACDMIGWSIYPHLSREIPDPIPDGFYDPLLEAAARVRKASAVTESGTASAPVQYGWITLDSHPERQVQATEALLKLAEEGDMAFFVNWTSHDFPAFLEKIPEEARELAGLWASSGILDGEGGEKPVTPLWRDWLARSAG